MSLLWRDQLCISLSPDQVSLVRLGKGLRRRVMEKSSHSFTVNNGATWQPAIGELEKLLKQQGNADASVVLSNQFSRYLIVPWSDAVSGAEELVEFTRHRCNQVYGQLAADWDLRFSLGCFGAPLLACGVERSLLDAIRHTCEAAGVRLISVQPALMTVFNRKRAEMKAGGWLVFAERGRLTLALAYGNGWHAVQTRHIDGPLSDALPIMLEQEQLLVDMADVPRTAWIFAPEQTKLAVSSSGNWSVNLLSLPAMDGFSPHDNSVFGLALAGAV